MKDKVLEKKLLNKMKQLNLKIVYSEIHINLAGLYIMKEAIKYQIM
jgi:hypothetical protein